MKKIIHIITGLDNGGAEMMLYKLLSNIEKGKYDIEVVSMTDEGFFGSKIKDLGIKVHTLDMKKGIPTISGIKKAVNIVKDADVVQTWMYHSDLLGLIVCKIAGIKKLIWGIHHSNLDKDKNKKLVLLVAKVNSMLSKYTYKITSCSTYATKVHIDFGYDESKFVNIPNGFDLDMYYNREGSRESVCRELNIDSNKKIVCHVARWDILKDYKTLTTSLGIVSKELKDVEFILCGGSIDNNNIELKDLLKQNNISKNTHLLGIRSDIPKIMSAADIFVLSSSGEAFPNVIGEAMACETPCVVTDVGDCKYIVDQYGTAVEKQNPTELANGIINMLKLGDNELINLGIKSRERVIDNFEISKVVNMFENLYK
ncbi:glycosyltransferase [Romboutsia weinsteinii]|uniref:Glycosyltransferase n=1 Tax=Romboutsia weinsteinii TaxID=2020949 RepID=A0A371J3V0_9FIRM|nr:glycosyltransferase [Romboutsia weinsteinii]RDY27393.1 glycosyltransferase [Romboutsia weinsteinii]